MRPHNSRAAIPAGQVGGIEPGQSIRAPAEPLITGKSILSFNDRKRGVNVDEEIELGIEVGVRARKVTISRWEQNNSSGQKPRKSRQG